MVFRPEPYKRGFFLFLKEGGGPLLFEHAEKAAAPLFRVARFGLKFPAIPKPYTVRNASGAGRPKREAGVLRKAAWRREFVFLRIPSAMGSIISEARDLNGIRPWGGVADQRAVLAVSQTMMCSPLVSRSPLKAKPALR